MTPDAGFEEWERPAAQREHDCCPTCGRGSCPGSGSRGADACTYRPPIPRAGDTFTSTPDAAAAYERRRAQAVDAAHPLDCRCSRACVAEAM